HFAHDGGDVAVSGSPGHIMRLAYTELVHVFYMEADDPSFEQLQAFNGVQPGANPVSDVGACAHERTAVGQQGGNDLRMPVSRWQRMVVNGQLDLIFFA